MPLSLPLAILSALLILTSLGVMLKQSQAKSCRRHQHLTGLVAQIIAFVCLAAGIILAGVAFLARE
jgi:MFS superfamily sulfate permease-like transporter